MAQKGSCLCGAVAFDITGDLRPVIFCHCGQCRKTSGHFWAATQVPKNQLTMSNAAGLTWFRSSDHARRGFCRECGSSLFWEMDGQGATSIAAGALDSPSQLTAGKHIFMADKGDYYTIADGLPQIARY